ncbi:MAG: hypothetical protein NVS3B20_14890 [Polyangiales bacterium]
MESTSRAGATVERLLEAAESAFASAGFDGARLEDIAAAVGVRRASLLYHFESKQALYERVLARAFADLHATITTAFGRKAVSFAERLDDVIDRSIDTFVRRPTFARLILRDSLDHDGFAAARARRFVTPLLSVSDAFIRDGQRAGEFRLEIHPRTVVLFFVGSLLFHAAQGDAQREVLWGSPRASGRGLRKYQEQMRAMLRQLVSRDGAPGVHALMEPSPAATHRRLQVGKSLWKAPLVALPAEKTVERLRAQIAPRPSRAAIGKRAVLS